MKKVVDKSIIESLTEAEKQLVAAMGIELVTKKQYKRTKRANAPDEYELKLEIKCAFCDHVQVQYFRMEKHGDALCSRKIPKFTGELPQRCQGYQVSACPFCKKYLETWTKQDLVNGYMECLIGKKVKN